MPDNTQTFIFVNDTIQKGPNATGTLNGSITVNFRARSATGSLTESTSDGVFIFNGPFAFGDIQQAPGIHKVNGNTVDGRSIFQANFDENDQFQQIVFRNFTSAGFVNYFYSGPACYVSGTLIRTTRGDLRVEALQIGDLAITASGTARPIRWLAHRTLDCRRVGPCTMPVRIAAHAFGGDLPRRDLQLSPGHPVLVGADEDGSGGHLVPIMCLINGTTIDRVDVDSVTYWHVELDRHDLLLAEGLPAESYFDLGSKAWFDGMDEAFHDPDLALPGMPGRCRPVAVDGPVVEAAHRRLDIIFAHRLTVACAWPRESEPAAFSSSG